ncbi:MAG TPA: MBL fold metallo-hydrolase RNA specificity domain-containing protein [archaeon]|nr:MBL fold metallo-hydrolase RNA specificity domain-containing protein [archaeon]
MHIFHKGGIVFRSKEDLFVDASGIREKQALITHAHSDHAKATLTNTYYMTPQTSALICAQENGLKVNEIPFGKNFNVGDFSCRFHPSGHILGSAQLEVSNGAHAVLTSDFKLQKSILFPGAEILPSEILVIETTFGTPQYRFPEREQVYEDMVFWARAALKENKFIVFGGYSTGKAQELTKIATEMLGQTPLVYKKIFEQNRVYESHGVKLGPYLELNHNLADANILIMPPHLIDDNLILALQHQLKRKVSVAIATGWNNHSKYKTFPLSDHADFSSLMHYVKESAPKLVLTTHGFEDEFADAVSKKLGIPARPLSRNGQSALDDFVG